MGLSHSSDDACPCGGITPGATFADCCEPALSGLVWPQTAEALMRSRYTAFVLRDDDHLFRTWHPRTRPAAVSTDPATRWTGLEILHTSGGGTYDDTGTVEFAAHYRGGVQRENSRFARRAGRWFYVDGDVD